jgi:hypothetical protein
MKFNFRAAALAVGALLCFSASQAFAGLSLVSSGPTTASWQQTWTVNQSGGIGNVQGPFDKIVATTAGNVTFTVSAGTFTIANQSLFEDLSSTAGHKAWTNFSSTSGSPTWAQSSIGSPATAASTTTATGNKVLGSGNLPNLTFTLNFTGFEQAVTGGTDTYGAHYFLDFFNGTSLVSRYEVKDIINASGVQGTEITQVPVPVPASLWAGLATFVGMGAFAFGRRRNRANLA